MPLPHRVKIMTDDCVDPKNIQVHSPQNVLWFESPVLRKILHPPSHHHLPQNFPMTFCEMDNPVDLQLQQGGEQLLLRGGLYGAYTPGYNFNRLFVHCHLRQTVGHLDMAQPLFEVQLLLPSDFHEQ